ncbi:MAG: amidohydrolase family protein [Glaciecola sp.]
MGSDAEVLKYKNAETIVRELKGNTLVPGFVDAHSHFSGVGTQAIVANLLPAPDGTVNTIADLQMAMRNYIDTSAIVKNYNVAIGFNYDDSQLIEKRHPTRHDLDAVSTTIPIIIMHQSGHLGVYNTKALDLMGISAETEDPSGGIIEREADGKTPNGVMQENAHFMIFFKMIPDIAAIGDVPLLHSDLMSTEYTNGFRLGGVKLTFDGSPQGKTAWFTQPYYKALNGQTADYAGYPAFSDQDAI